MPITVRYGPAGLALQAAQRAGEGQDFWRRHAAGQQMVDQIRNYYLAQDQQRIDAMRTGAGVRSLAPRPQAARQATAPVAQITHGGPTGSPTPTILPDTGEGEITVGGKTYRMAPTGTMTQLDEFGQPVETTPQAAGMGFAGGFQTPQQTARQQLVASLAGQAGPEAAPILQSLAANPRITDEQLAEHALALSREARLGQGRTGAAALTPYQQVQEQQEAIDIERRQLADQLKALERTARDEGIDLMAEPAAFAPPPVDRSGLMRGFWNVAETYGLADRPTAQGDQRAIRLLTERARIQNRLNALNRQRAETFQQAQTPPTGQPVDDVDLSQMSNEELLRQLMQ